MEQRFFSSTPFIRPALAITLGVIVSPYFHSQLWLLLLIISSLFGFIMYFFSDALGKYKLRFVLLFLSMLTFVSIGAYRSKCINDALNQDRRQLFETSSEYFVANLTSDPINGNGFVKCQANIVLVLHKKQSVACKVPVLLYFEKSSDTIQFAFGKSYLIKGRPKLFLGSSYPGAFDAAQYYARKGICASFYLPKNQYLGIQTDSNSFFEKLHRFRMHCLMNLKKCLKHDPSYRVSAAMLLGYGSEIDPELMQAYSETGVIHILSVSGLHVGIFYIVLQKVLSSLLAAKVRMKRWLTTVLSLPLIWGYTALTGFSAPAVRSAIMISLLILGNAFSKNTYIWNSLFASYSLLLLYDSQYLKDPGFQLSFAALAALISFQPLIIQILPLHNMFQRFCADWLSGSIAAQFGTLPILLYHFRFFPLLFLPANLIMIPLGSLGLPAGMLALSSTIFIPNHFAKFLFVPYEDLLRICNFLILLLHKLPLNTLLIPPVSIFSCTTLFIFLYTLGYALYSKQIRPFIPVFLFANLFLISFLFKKPDPENITILPTQYTALYSIANHEQQLIFSSKLPLHTKDSILLTKYCKARGLPFQNPILLPSQPIQVEYAKHSILINPRVRETKKPYSIIINPIKTSKQVYTIADASRTFEGQTDFKSPEYGTLTLNQILWNTSSLKPHWRNAYSAFRLTVLRRETRSAQKWSPNSSMRYAQLKRIQR